MKHFSAIIINSVPETYAGRRHADDPIIDLCSVTGYGEGEIAGAVQKALEVKRQKGQSYTADALILHTVKAGCKPYFPGTGMHAGQIVQAGRTLAPPLSDRFKEIWFLNAYFDADGKRLYRLA